MSERILVIRMSAMGDVIQSTPVARAIKSARPGAYLAWFVAAPFAPLLEHNPYIDELIVVPARPTLTDLAATWHKLRAGAFDIALDLQGLMKSAFFTYASGAPWRIGKAEARECTALFAYTDLSPERWDQQYISQRYLEVCSPLGVSREDFVPELFLTDEDFVLVDEVFAAESLGGPEPVIALVTFSAEPRREWPADYVIRLADMLIDRFGARIVLPGTARERNRAEALSSRMSRPAAILAGRTNMRQAAALMQRADLVVGVESGLTHMAYAVGTPLVCIHGYGPLRNDPIGPLTRSVFVPDIPCRPCRPSTPCPDRRCMINLQPEIVFAAIEDLVAQIPSFH